MSEKPPFTKAEFNAYLRTAWSKQGCEVTEDARMGISIEELEAFSEKHNSELVDQHFDLWIAVYDEFVSWLISLTSIVYSPRHSHQRSDFEMAVTVLLMRIIADSLSMRILMLRGFDASAKVILRSTSEHIEMLVAIISDPTIATEFVRTRHPNAAAAFWKKHVARGSLRPRLKKAWTVFFKGEVKPAKWFANWGSRDHQMYSAISHPSMFGCINAILPWKTAKTTDENWLGFLGRQITRIY